MKIDVVSFEEEAAEFLERYIYFKVYSRHRRVVNISVEDNIIPLVKTGYYLFPGSIVLDTLDYFLKNDYGRVFFPAGAKIFSLKKKKLEAKIDDKIMDVILNKIYSMNDYDDIFIKRNLTNWDRILGSGGGLTPKADDYILGYSVFSEDKDFKNFFYNTDFAGRTNMLSAYFLEKAKRGIYSETILNFISGKDISLLEWGDTSGIWTAFGIIRSLIGKRRQR